MAESWANTSALRALIDGDPFCGIGTSRTRSRCDLPPLGPLCLERAQKQADVDGVDKNARRADQHHEEKDRHLATDGPWRIHLGRTLRDNGEMLTKDGFHRQRWAGKEVSRETLLDEWG